MKKIINTLKADRLIYASLVLGGISVVVATAITLFSYSHLPPILPLFNQMPWGDMRLGVKNSIFIPIGFAASVYIINSGMAYMLYSKSPLLSRIVAITLAFICIFTLLLIIRTIQLVT